MKNQNKCENVTFDSAFIAGWELANWGPGSRCPNSNIMIADFSAALQLCWPPTGETKKGFIDKVSMLLRATEPQLELWFRIGLLSNGVIIESRTYKKNHNKFALNKLLLFQSSLASELMNVGANVKERTKVVTAVQAIFNDVDEAKGVGTLVRSVTEIMSRIHKIQEREEPLVASAIVNHRNDNEIPRPMEIKKEIIMDTTTAFISYSWDDKSHQNWAKLLAIKLRENGIESILDQWHAVPGDQLPDFMEKSIKNNDFVLMICTPNYKRKSDARTGGVGYEGDIITGEVFVKSNQGKFIPILARGSWQESAPTWLTGKYYIDLSGDDFTTDSFLKLVSTLRGENEVPPPVSKISAQTSLPISPVADSRCDQPIFAGRVSFKNLSNLPTGAILSSNLCNPDLTPLFTEEIGDETSRRTLWERMKIAGVSGSKVYVFANWAGYRDHMASRHMWSTNRNENNLKKLNPVQPAQFSQLLLDSITELHIPEHIQESILQVLSHPDFPQWMSVGGKLMRNPIWASISDEDKEAMRMSHELNGPSPPALMHLDMQLIRRNNKRGRGELLTYFSPDWNTYLIRFRQWMPEDDPKLRLEMNNKKMAKHCDGDTSSVSVKRLPGKFAVSVKPHPKYGDLIIYVFEFCSVVFKSEPSFIRDPEASEGLWFDIDSLKANCSSWAVNADVIRAIHELFTVSLGPLPVSYTDPRDVKKGRRKTNQKDTPDLKPDR